MLAKKHKIALIYVVTALISAAILFTAITLSSRSPVPKLPIAQEIGKQVSPEKWFPIEQDLHATNQSGAEVKLSDLKGKVILVAEFFAVCPHCAVRNGAELRVIYDQFKNDPNFHMVCISVDPEHDTQQKLRDYSQALSAEPKNWWFLRTESNLIAHSYLENTLKFFGIRERTSPTDIETNGRYSHDLGFLLIDKNFNVIGKYPLADARSEEMKKIQPHLYDELKKDLLQKIKHNLEK